MSDAEIERRMVELDRLLNDPEVRMDPHRVWALLAELSRAAQPVYLSGRA
ncbi:peptide chain release factor 1 [Neoroseomonas soli]|uniref:Peptide chain release factor 1 n=1 Tax=Neoroseomonas soli TaxID=1081025 RepID=A0A9X9X3T2_9PROT|nr:peptide chain release factor 1 [Neoroseomonas soli]MBR0674061.1 peptide chain release factor 1 [Neoroseomonas soli]